MEAAEATAIISTANATLSIPWKTRISLSVIATLTDAACRRDGTVNRRLMSFFDFKAPASDKPKKGVKSADVTVDPSRNLWIRVFTPTAEGELPVIVFFHGGGFCFLGADGVAYDLVCRRFARKVPAIVVSVNYRLAPEHRYPAQYDDGFDVLKFLDDEDMCRNYLPENADLSRCFVAGDSAGGNLAHHVALRACRSQFRKLKVIGQVSIQPFYGGSERTEAEKRLEGTPLVSVKRTEWMWKAFLPEGEEYDLDHQCINVSGPKAVDISGLEFPATLVFVAGFDMLQDWQRRYYQWLKRSGKEAYLSEYPNTFHAFYVFPELPESAQLILEVTEFIRKCSSGDSQHPLFSSM